MMQSAARMVDEIGRRLVYTYQSTYSASVSDSTCLTCWWVRRPSSKRPHDTWGDYLLLFDLPGTDWGRSRRCRWNSVDTIYVGRR